MGLKDALQAKGKNYMAEDKVFVDTNIIVYAYDVSAKGKNETAKNILMALWDS